jgi:hypothetical protein
MSRPALRLEKGQLQRRDYRPTGGNSFAEPLPSAPLIAMFALGVGTGIFLTLLVWYIAFGTVAKG